ncbi:MAG: ATP-binding protein [Gallionellaceae bacterium]|nr:ATP-binding protein [Gallionellaceae bacterium]
MNTTETTMKPISALTAISNELKSENCEKHGNYSSRNLYKTVWSTCPKCAAEQADKRRNEEAEKAAQERHRAWQKRLGEAGIPDRFQNRTLDSYSATSEGQKRALAFATSYADQFDESLKSGRSAIFCGKPGTGKTHLAVGVALQIMKCGRCAMFTTVQRMVRRVKDTFRKNSEESEGDVINMLTYPDLLIIDEIGVQFGSDFEKNLMFDILNERYEKLRPTLLLSNLTAPEIKAFLGERIYDRLREDGGQFVPFDWQSHRGS